MSDFWQPPLGDWDQTIRALAERISKPVPKDCKIDIYPLEEINAVARSINSGKSFEIGINSGLLAFISNVSSISAGYFPLPQNPQEALNINPIGSRDFVLLLLCLVGFKETSRPLTESSYFDPDRVELAAMLRDLSTFYVVAHEYAHVMLGHHKRLSGARRRVSAGRYGTFDEIPLSHELELEADALAQTLTLAFAEQCEARLALALWAIDFYFACIAFLEQFIPDVILPIAHLMNKAARSRLGLDFPLPNSIPPSGTHPPPDFRREALRQIMVRMLGNERQEGTEIEAAYTMAKRSDPFIRSLWAVGKNSFSDAVAQALRHQ